MSLTPLQYQQIVDFLDASMSVEEMNWFQQELSANTELRDQLDFEKAVRESFQSKRSIGGSAEQSIAPAEPQKQVIQMWPAWKRWTTGIAAAALLVIAGKLLFFSRPVQENAIAGKKVIPPHKKDTVQIAATPPADSVHEGANLIVLYKKYFKKDAPPQEPPMLLADALVQYNNGDYNSIQHFNMSGIPATRGNDAVNSKENILRLAHYYKGISFLQTNNTPNAIDNLEWVLANNPDKYLQVKASWYLALAYVKNNNAHRALPLLITLENNKEDAGLGKQAAALKKALKK